MLTDYVENQMLIKSFEQNERIKYKFKFYQIKFFSYQGSLLIYSEHDNLILFSKSVFILKSFNLFVVDEHIIDG